MQPRENFRLEGNTWFPTLIQPFNQLQRWQDRDSTSSSGQKLQGVLKSSLCHEKCGPGWGEGHFPHPRTKGKASLILLKTGNLAAPRDSILGTAHSLLRRAGVVGRLLPERLWAATVDLWEQRKERLSKPFVVTAAHRTVVDTWEAP